ncbi:MAG TPA: hypothetical protein H9668_10120 [Firmicutes bacterium]|nr:hypothetical protein [Bacillota bacterium]
MKKKILACILAAGMLALLAGCGNGEPQAEVETSSAPAAGRQASTPRVTAAADTSAAAPDTGDDSMVSEVGIEPPNLQVTPFSPEVDGIAFDMTPEEVLEALEDKGMELRPVDLMPDGIENPVKDGRQYNATSGSFYYYTVSDIMITFSPEGDEMWHIDVGNPSIATAEGLRIGDSIQKMESLYGTAYRKDVEDFPVYQYYNGTHYLDVFYEGDAVRNWRIDTWPGINHD